MGPLRVVVVGAGPAGLYAADALLFQQDVKVQIDVLDALPTPFGLLRYGVAPDHLKMKSLSRQLQRVLDDERVHFFGNVLVGRDVTVMELRARYHAVVFAHGAPGDRRLGIPGEELRGCLSAGALVAWYSGHPDRPLSEDLLATDAAAVIGAGNVALDLARVLLRDPEELAYTDVPETVLDGLRSCPVTDIHLLARRSPAEARFTTKELRELGELSGVDVVVDPASLALSPREEAALSEDPSRPRNLEVLRTWAERPVGTAPRRLHLHFRCRPVEVLGQRRVSGLKVESTVDGVTTKLPVGLVLTAIGQRGVPLAGVPFDGDSGTLPRQGSRLVRGDAPSSGEYVCGWAARGPVGVLGTNRADGEDVAAAVLADASELLAAPLPEEDLATLLQLRGCEAVTSEGWRRIDCAEIALGTRQGQTRGKLVPRELLLATARS